MKKTFVLLTALWKIQTKLAKAVVGKYTIAASADGYTTQQASKDVSAADATQNFTLVP